MTSRFLQRSLTYRRVSSNVASAADDSLELSSYVAGKEQDRGRHDSWSPFVLKRRSLCSFITVFVLLTTAIIFLWIASNHVNGLVSADLNHHYLWTYGPTAVFTILSALWGQVEYRTLQLSPWRSMQHGYVPASQSVLLDYLSDWNVRALVRSLRRKHFMVSIAICVSLLLKLLTAFSTGLFTITIVRVSGNVELILNTMFDSRGFNSSTVDARSYMQSWGTKNQGLQFPLGTLWDDDGYHAFETIHEVPLNRTSHANVGVFTPSLNCVQAEAVTNETSQAVTLRTNNCSVDVPPDDATTKFHYLELILASCSGQLENTTDWRLWTYVAVDSELQQGQPVSHDRETIYVDFVALMCTPSYLTSQGHVTWTGTSDKFQPRTRIENKTQVDIAAFNTIPPSDLLFAAHQSAKWAVPSFVRRQAEFMYLDIDSDTESRESLHTNNMLNHTVIDRTNSYIVQVVNNYLLRHAEEPITGTTTSSQTRLVLRELSVWIMVSVLLTITSLTLVLTLYYLPLSGCPQDPGTIAGFATILANSPALKTSLSQRGSATNEELIQILEATSFSYTADSRGYEIKQKGEHHGVQNPIASHIRWWRPFSTSWWFRAMPIFVPLILLVALEVTYRDSESRQGIADMLLGSTINAASVYIPALVFLATRTLFESVYFSARIFQPYHNLKQGHARPDTAILSNQHRSLAVVGVWKSLCQKQWPVLAAGVAVLVGPLLPIVVSGLYVIDDVSSPTEISLKQLNRINMTDECFMCNSGYGQKTWPGNFILEFNASYPKWTYGKWAFPKIIANDNNTNAIAGKLSNTTEVLDNSLISLRLPALHIDLSCTETPVDNYKIGIIEDYETYVLDYGIVKEKIVRVNVTQMNNYDAAVCGFGSNNSFSTPAPAADGYFGIWATPTTRLNLTDCATIVAVYGRLSSDAASVSTVTAVQCRPRVKQTEVNINLRAYTYDIDLTTPPSPISNSTKILYDGYMPYVASAYEHAPTQEIVGPLLVDSFFVLDNTGETSSLSSVFRSMASGANGVGEVALLDPATLISSLQRTVGIFMAQILSSTGYEDYTLNETAVAVSDRPTYTGIMTYPYRKRLIQNQISTRILQGILLFMCICGATSMFLMNTKKILPKNPMSIAALASLLADSEMATKRDEAGRGLVPASADEGQQRTLESIYGGRTYSMGWSVQEDGGVNSIERKVIRSNERLNGPKVEINEINEERASRKRMIYAIDVDHE